VQPVAGQVHIFNHEGLIQPGQNTLDLIDEIRPYLAAVPALVPAFQSPVLEIFDPLLFVNRQLSLVNQKLYK
jgi:hypothetical protein